MALLIDDLLHLSRLWRTEIQGVKEVDLSAEVDRDRRGTAAQRAGPPRSFRHPAGRAGAGGSGADPDGAAESAGERLEVHRQLGTRR
jgi:hypothetical protein